MKILCVIDSLGSGGAQRQLVNLAVSFKEKGHDVDFLIYYDDKFYYNYLLENNIKVIQAFEENYIKRILKIRRIIRTGAYDSVLSFLEVPNFICELASFPNKSWKLVVGERSANPKIRSSLKLVLYRKFHALADAVVANSHANMRLIQEVNPYLSKTKCHVIYNMVNFEKWEPKIEQYQYRKNNKLNIVVAARHHYLKNLNCLIEAINLLSDSEKNQLNVEWYGRPEDNSLEEALVKIDKYNLKRVFSFYDPTSDINLKVNSSDVLGLFSFYEGLPNTVCEAMTNQKLIIASNVSDINNLIDKDFVFDPHSEKDLSAIISRVLNMDEQCIRAIGVRNREKALKLFDEKNISESYLDLLS